ncbi:UNVERIFIED_CONTAM: hypothetical protein NCL1_05190 [Trichonephila clavipes]
MSSQNQTDSVRRIQRIPNSPKMVTNMVAKVAKMVANLVTKNDANLALSPIVPQLNLRLGSKLRHSNILEGNDVYFECNIRASPWVHETGWRFEGQELVTNISAGVIVSNQSLVLQKVQRRNRGRYSCTGTNSEGQGESNHMKERYNISTNMQLWLSVLTEMRNQLNHTEMNGGENFI